MNFKLNKHKYLKYLINISIKKKKLNNLFNFIINLYSK